jgi:hypothetical protein
LMVIMPPPMRISLALLREDVAVLIIVHNLEADLPCP